MTAQARGAMAPWEMLAVGPWGSLGGGWAEAQLDPWCRAPGFSWSGSPTPTLEAFARPSKWTSPEYRPHLRGARLLY